MIVEADDKLIACDDEFEGGGVINSPEEARFDLSLEFGDLLFESFNLGEGRLHFWVEIFESGPLGV